MKVIFSLHCLDFCWWEIGIHTICETAYQNYFGKIKYILYKTILYKDKEYFDTYDMGKLNTAAESGSTLERMFKHKFLDVFRMGAFVISFTIVTYNVHFRLSLALFIPIFLKLAVSTYRKKIF